MMQIIKIDETRTFSDLEWCEANETRTHITRHMVRV